MSRSIKTAMRLLAAVAAISLAPMLSAPAGPGSTPYASALSNLSVPQTFAASTCNFKACGGSRHNEACNPIKTPAQCTNVKGFCIIGNCT